MKHSLTVLLLGLTTLVSAQNDGFQYPFPYNPDGNSDGYISLSDMLDLLSVYGQEFPESFATDTSRAVLNLGYMGSYNCLLQAEAAGREWRMMQDTDIPYFLGTAADVIPANNTGSWCWHSNESRPDFFNWIYEESPTGNYDYVFNSDNSRAYRVEWSGFEASRYTDYSLCLIVSEVLPEYEFSFCNTTSSGTFESCVTEKLNDGWIPMPGGTQNSANRYHQSFWRIAED